MTHMHDLIAAYVDGRLAEADREAVDAHCAVCPDCARALAETRAVWDLMGEAHAPEPTRSVWPDVVESTAPRQAPAWRRAAFGTLSAAAAAGGLLIGVQQYTSGGLVDLAALDETLDGTTLAGDTSWSFGYALDDALSLDTGEED